MVGVRLERDGPILRVILARPEIRNALDGGVIAELMDAFSAPRLADVRAVVLAGDGKSFCAGGDIAAMRAAATRSYEDNVAEARALAKLLETINSCPVPVVARVQGHAVGGGMGLVVCADIAVAEEDVVFGFAEVKLGVVPAVISPYVLAKIGQSQARALFLTGEGFDAATALRIGLVHRVAAQLDEAVDDVLRHLLAAGPDALRLAKRLVLEPALPDKTPDVIAERRVSAEGQEGLSAFLERRRPSYASELSPPAEPGA